jgi:glutathione S-transferase
MMSAVKLYGVPLSPPFRAVAWTLLQRHVPFEIKLTIPGATNKMGSLHESFLSKTKGRTGRVPVLEEGSLCVSESPAILSYLCESRGWVGDLYGPPGTAKKALIDSYMHWHHDSTRHIAALTMPYTRPELKLTLSEQEQEKARLALESLNSAWLKDDAFIAGGEQHSIADILAYEEVVQATMTGALDLSTLDYPNLAAWVERMQQVPFHDAAHASLTALGLLTNTMSDTPIRKRLGTATKEGMKAIQQAQENYVS